MLRTYHGLVACLILTLTCSFAQAQLPQSRLYAVFPPGAQAGQATEITITAGDDLDEVDRLIFNHPGISCEPRADFPASGVNVPYRVAVAADVPPGLYEVRASGRFGISNPRRFQVGTRPVIVESEGNNNSAEADELAVNHLVYGRMNGGADVDWFKVSLKRGQTVVCDCTTERIDSRLITMLELFDSSGRKRLGSVRSLPGRDPVLPFLVPADGDYLLKLHDTTYRGGNEYVYGLTVHDAPHIEYSQPSAVIAGSTTTVSLFGYNLPGGTSVGTSESAGPALQRLDVDVTPPAEPVLQVDAKLSPSEAAIDAFSYRLPADQGGSNPIRLGLTTSQLAVEQEQTPEAPQTVTLPVDISGQFAFAGDTDRYRFSAKKGETISIEVLGQRMGTSVDPILVVEQIKVDQNGQETVTRLTAQDDERNNPLQNVFEILTEDPAYRWQVAEDGIYQVTLRDRYWETRGDTSLGYRCNIRFAQPGFRLVVLPSAPTAGQTWPVGLHRGDNFSAHVLAFRHDGYEGPIEVHVEGLPEGITSQGAILGPKEITVPLTFQVGLDATAGWHPVTVVGTARIEDSGAVQAVTSAKAAVQQASSAIPVMQGKSGMLAEKLEAMQKALAQVKTAIEGAPIEEPMKKELDAAGQQILGSLMKAHEQSLAELKAGQDALTAAQASLEAAVAHQQQVARQLREQARVGTILWSSAANVPAISRVTDRLGISVIAEPAPFQLLTNLKRVEVRPGRQLLLTTQVERRAGFEEVVKLDIQGLPKTANIDIEKGEVAKDQSEKLLKVFVKPNSPAGSIFTAWLSSEGEVNYTRNPERVARFQKALEAVQQQLASAKVKADETAKAKADAEAAMKAATEQVQLANAKLKEQQEAYTSAQKEVELATLEVQKQQGLVSKGEALVAASKNVAAQLEKSVMDSAGTVNAASNALEAAGQLLQASPESAELKQRVDAAKAAFDSATRLVEDLKKQAMTAAADLAATEQQHKLLVEKLAAANKSLADRQAAAVEVKKLADQAQVNVQTQVAAELAAKKSLEAASQAAQAAATELSTVTNQEKAATQAVTDATKASAAKKIKFTPPSEPVIFVVKPAPVEVKPEVPNGGAIKAGEPMPVKVKVVRKDGFAGPVTVSLGDVAEGRGISAPAVTIPAESDEAVLMITAVAEAAEGDVANAVIRTQSEFDGEAIVDAPVALKVTK